MMNIFNRCVGFIQLFVAFIFCLGMNAAFADEKNAIKFKGELDSPRASVAGIKPNTITPVEFSVHLNGKLAENAITLEEVDEQSQVIATLGLLTQNASNLKRGRNFYTLKINLQSADIKNRYFRIRVTAGDRQYLSKTLVIGVTDVPTVTAASAQSELVLDPKTQTRVFTNELIIKLKQGAPIPSQATLDHMVASVGGNVESCLPAIGHCLVRIPPATTSAALEVLIKTLKTEPEIEDAFLSVEAEPQGNQADTTCNGGTCQWHLTRVRAPDAWRLAAGGDAAHAVGIIDFGVNCSLSALGCTSDSPDSINHGTGVASFIGAKLDPANGSAGVAWNAPMFSYGLLVGNGSQYTVAEKILTALQQGNTRVINISAITGFDSNNLMLSALCTAAAQGTLTVVAAGNPLKANNCNSGTYIYPPSYNATGVCSNGANIKDSLLVVGATDNLNNLAEWNTSGNAQCSDIRYAEIFAPGKDIRGLNNDGTWSNKTGTSYASPIVAGAAALTWAAHPDLTAVEVHNRLLQNASILSATATAANQFTSDSRMVGKRLLDVAQSISAIDISKEYRLQSYWAFDFYINNQTGLQASTILPGWWSARWKFTKVSNNVYRIQNVWKPAEYLKLSGNTVSGGSIDGTELWKLNYYAELPVTGAASGHVYRIENVAQPGRVLNLEGGTFQATNVPLSFWSARWAIMPVL